MACPRVLACASFRGGTVTIRRTPLCADGGPAIRTSPLLRTRTRIGRSTIPPVTAGLVAHWRGAIRIEPPSRALARVRSHTGAVHALLLAQRNRATHAAEARLAGARIWSRANFARSAGSAANWRGAV